MTDDIDPSIFASPKALLFIAIVTPAVALPVISLLLAALRGIWHYWHRSTSRTHATIKVLAVISVFLCASSFLLVRDRRWLLVASLGVGPLAILLHMMWTWLKYQGPPQEFEQLPKPLEELDGVVTTLGQGADSVVFRDDDIREDDIGDQAQEDESLPSPVDQHSTRYRLWAGVNGVVYLVLSAAGADDALHQPSSLFGALLCVGALFLAAVFLRDAITGRISIPVNRWIYKP